MILPEFRAGRMDRGVSAGTRAILEVISGEVLPRPARESRREAPRWVVLLWIVFVVLMLLARGLFFTPPFGGPGMRRGGRSGGFPPLGGGFGRGGGLGGGGGGFGGGGGGFGGGGASGRW